MKKKDVAATLENGRYLTGANLIAIYIGLISSLLLFVVVIFGLVIVTFGFMVLTAPVLICMIGFTVLGLILSAIFACQIRKNYLIGKKIDECFIDAIETVAMANIVDTFIHNIIFTQVKISVTFVIDGKAYTRISGEKNSNRFLNGYDKIFGRYVNRKIRILYSRKFDRVLILK